VSKSLVNKKMPAVSKSLVSKQARAFSHGPYNPLIYKTHIMPEELPTTEDMYANIKTFHSEPPQPIYNMRHIHPVRQSGPIPAYDGPWTMEDIKKLYGQMRAPWDHMPQSTDIEELMRRAPGLTRREALRIQ
jgi:hypothetical protein